MVVLDPPFDLATPTGEAMAMMLAVFAQFERRLIGQRIREALAVKRTQGVRLGRRSTLDPAAVERVVELRAEGLPWRAVAEAMTQEGWPTGQGGAWAPSTCRLLWLRAHEAEAEAEGVVA